MQKHLGYPIKMNLPWAVACGLSQIHTYDYNLQITDSNKHMV